MAYIVHRSRFTPFEHGTLFFAEPVRQGDNLHRTLARLHRDLVQLFAEKKGHWRHEELAAYTFSPELESHRLDLTLQLKRQPVKCRFLFVTFEGLGRQLAFSPGLPPVWFEVARGETLRDRATEVLTRYFREREKEDDAAIREPGQLSLRGQAWVTTLEVALPALQAVREVEENLFAVLGAPPVLDGAAELRRVGYCLDTQYPDELDRVLFRDREVAELTRLLASDDRRPVLLVGPRQVGKTAIVHEYVYRQVEKRRRPYSTKANVWLLSPPRLISGMSYVGQWENRLLAILKEARKRRHVLYFDDFLGLYHAGISSCSSLSVAHVLKPYVERREVRVLAEMTPEALRVFREQDRGFADLFHLIAVGEPAEEETLRILVAAARQYEGQQQCRFALDVLPTVYDLQRRYARAAAFPGKAAAFLRRLAVKCRQGEASRARALEEFHAQSGLAVAFLDSRVKLERQDVLQALAGQVIGQDAALQAAADVIAIAKARLNDPDRPLASLLFLGPTGVGKTQCAKAVAAYLFGDADKVLRFDMNEYVSPTSVARLVGTFHEPEGLLTSAVRRQPFAVVLLDEIEKADPGVFDLLLQVLGEGRLTDALGRTTDFSNTILILTSNLGVREAESRFGFRPSDGEDGHAFVQAAERFFRPEFFNRLDRVVPFRRLGREDMGRIARLLLQGVFAREGLLRRKCVLHVDDRALESVVNQGYDPLLGARALKRAMERQLTQPVAAQLARRTAEGLTLISLYPGPDRIAIDVQSLAEVKRPEPSIGAGCNPPILLDRVEAFVRRIESQLAPLRPDGPLTLGRIQPEHYRYFAVQEQAVRLRERCRQLVDRLDAARLKGRAGPTYPHDLRGRERHKKVSLRLCNNTVKRNLVAELAAAQDVHEYLKEIARAAVSPSNIDTDLAEILRQTTLLQAMAEAGANDSRLTLPTPPSEGGVGKVRGDQVVLYVRELEQANGSPSSLWLLRRYASTFGEEWGLSTVALSDHHPERGEERAIAVKGAHALTVAGVEAGTHLFCCDRQTLRLVQVRVWPVAGEDPMAVLTAQVGARQQWLRLLAEERTSADEDPFRWQPILRIYDESGPTVDLRSGLVSSALPDVDSLRTFILGALPLPPELHL